MLAQRGVAFSAQVQCLCRKRFTRLGSQSLIPAYIYWERSLKIDQDPY